MIAKKFHIVLNDELLDNLLAKCLALLRHLPFIGIEPPICNAEQYQYDDHDNQNLPC
jgi:hypothetical protein